MLSRLCARDAISVMVMTDLRLFPILATPSDRTVTGSPRGREAPGVCRLTGPRTRPHPSPLYPLWGPRFCAPLDLPFPAIRAVMDLPSVGREPASEQRRRQRQACRVT